VQPQQNRRARKSRGGPGILRLAGPLVANNLALAGMNFADTVMAGRLGTVDLAAVAVGGSAWMLVFLLGLGMLMAVSPWSRTPMARAAGRMPARAAAGPVAEPGAGGLRVPAAARRGPRVLASIGVDETWCR
jgi:hypothetical protein